MSSGGGNTQVTTENPYAPSEPYLKDIMSEAENIYQSDAGKSYFPGSTVVPFAPDTAAALAAGERAKTAPVPPPAANIAKSRSSWSTLAASSLREGNLTILVSC